ncbi:unnamed protein product [Euphydryas editha]|uniref:Gag-like protein n=1 Tax=Euphydryas editha TaxID=104508 RepID=A0AAU9UJ55_EUPED|nr:unnamed protein product [Euphydryas editha]
MADGRFGQSVSLTTWTRSRKLHYPRRIPTPQASENPATLRRAAPSNLGGNDRVCVAPTKGGVGCVPAKGGEDVRPEKGGGRLWQPQVVLTRIDQAISLESELASESADRRPEKGGDDVGPEEGDNSSDVIELSDTSMRSESPHDSDSPGRFWKRRRCETDDGASDADNDDAPAKISTARRGRGRPPTTGQYVGLAKAKSEYLAQCQKELELQAESEVVAITRQIRATRAAAYIDADRSDECSTRDLHKRAQECVDAILKLTKSSKNIKGTFRKAFNESAETIAEVLGVLYQRTSTDEIRQLQEANDRLRSENAQLRSEIAELRQGVADIRRELSSTSAPAPPASNQKAVDDDAIVKKIMDGVDKLINARFRELEASGRLLPETRTRQGQASASTERTELPTSQPAEPSVTTLTPPANPGTSAKSRKRKRTKKGAVAQAAAPPEPRPTPPAPAAPAEGWNVVARRGLASAGRRGDSLGPPLHPI